MAVLILSGLDRAAVAGTGLGAGSIEGRVSNADGEGIEGALATLVEQGQTTSTRPDGAYRLSTITPGIWTLRFTLPDGEILESAVEVAPGRSTRLDQRLEARAHVVESITVTSASRWSERWIDAPTAVTRFSEAEVSLRAPAAQVPKLLELTPGLELTQSGLYDFNVNTRGFNGPLTRRLAVLIDGRDPSIPFLGAQEWAAFSLPFEDLESVEVARGPSAALYGPNASSGVVNLITKAPRASAGGLLRLTGGGLDTANADLRWAGELGGSWWKLLGGYRSSETFARSRRGAAEYARPCPAPAGVACLPQETADPEREVEGWAGSLRLDRQFGDQFSLVLEGGDSAVAGATVLTNIGRVSFAEVDRPWARARLAHPRWQVQTAYNRRKAPRQTNLSSGRNLALESENWTLELQGNRELGRGLRLTAGLFLRRERVESSDPRTGAQTLLFEAVRERAFGLFGQLAWQAAPGLEIFLAGRWDNSETFYEHELSPRASLVWSPRPRHTLRLTYSEAFQAPNYAEKLAQAEVGSVALQALEAHCAPSGIDCGFGGADTRLLAVGNPDLGVERVRAFELGYRALLGSRAFLTLDLYRSGNEDFITDLLPEHTTPLGDINRAFGPYRAPAGLPIPAADALSAAVQVALGPLAPLLTNNHDGDPFVALLTYGSFGEVNTQGAELALSYAPNARWSFSASTSLVDFELERTLPGLDRILTPNAPERQARASAAFRGERLDLQLTGRRVEAFFWTSGTFSGRVPSFTTFDLSGRYRRGEWGGLGLEISNLLNEEHFEAFGGDLIGRRALVSFTLHW